jgi:putative zinc finger/helix-turn-helix YgiT family protein
MKCFQCGKGRLLTKSVDIEGDVRGEPMTVRAETDVCGRCGFQFLSNAQSAAYGIAVADAYRKRHSLLTSKELKAIRKTLAMSQRDFAEFLGVGVASVKRWEAGLIQDQAMDKLIRLATDLGAARNNVKQLEGRLRLTVSR